MGCKIILTDFFRAKNTDDLKKLILSGSYSLKGTVWRETSKEVKDLLQKMLIVQPCERISIDDVLKHDWFEKVQFFRNKKTVFALFVFVAGRNFTA